MENVQFEENQDMKSFQASPRKSGGSVTAIFIKIGLAKDQKQANNVMLVFSIICLAIMAYFLFKTFF